MADGRGNVELGEQLTFSELHHLGFGVFFVIHAEQMQDPVHHEESELVFEGDLMFLGVLRRDGRTDDDVTEQHEHLISLGEGSRPRAAEVRGATPRIEVVLQRKGQHVRWAGLPEEALVQ